LLAFDPKTLLSTSLLGASTAHPLQGADAASVLKSVMGGSKSNPFNRNGGEPLTAISSQPTSLSSCASSSARPHAPAPGERPGHVAELPALVRTCLQHGGAVEEDVAGCWPLELEQQPAERALSGSGRPDNEQARSGRHVE